MSGETESQISGWTVDTLHQHYDHVLAEKDRRYEQRFEAQERALQIALDSVNREFHEHLLQVERETQSAFLASEKAITKAEASVERRLEGMNEFRAALADSTNKNISRAEHETATKSLTEKIDTMAHTFTEKVDDVKNRQIATDASSLGQTSGRVATVDGIDRNRNLMLGVITAVGVIVGAVGVAAALLA